MTSVANSTIGIELINDKNWMGGTLYLRNLVVILSQLPASERPKIKLFGSQTMINELEEEIGRQRDTNSRFWADKLFNFFKKEAIHTRPLKFHRRLRRGAQQASAPRDHGQVQRRGRIRTGQGVYRVI